MAENTETARYVPSKADTPVDRSPVFIVGVMHRCGTNYLSHLLRLHPVFKMPASIVEDYSLKHATLLVDYVKNTYEAWGRGAAAPDDHSKAQLLEELGGGIVRFLSKNLQREQRLLVKTPRPYNLQSFFQVFPEAKLLILVRDGRDVVESAERSWRWKPSIYWMLQWAAGAREILEFTRQAGKESGAQRWMLLKYEDLVDHSEGAMSDVLRFLELDPNQFNWERLDKIPLRGSSVHRGPEETLNWQPVDKPEGFRPVGRWHHWSWPKRKLFALVAGTESAALGYGLPPGPSNPG